MLTTASAARKDANSAGKATFEHRHFSTVAAIIKNMSVTADVRHEIAQEFATALASTNPRFDRQHFLAACGL